VRAARLASKVAALSLSQRPGQRRIFTVMDAPAGYYAHVVDTFVALNSEGRPEHAAKMLQLL
jgi:hypothetical protein